MDLLARFAESLTPDQAASAADVREYIEWQTSHHAKEFIPADKDDVDLRTYLLHLRTAGADRQALRRVIESLKRLYRWALTQGLIDKDPFDEFDFDRPLLSRDQLRRREETLGRDSQERELARLRGLNRVAEQLNRAADVQSALNATLETLLEVMQLPTAWAFLLTGQGVETVLAGDDPPGDFGLAAACGLPPALQADDSKFLRDRPECHCQSFFRSGRLARAVNIVECTRLQRAEEARGDTAGLLFHASVPIISNGALLGIINVATSEWQFLTSADLQFLTAVGSQVAVAVERARLYELAHAQRDRLERELQVARQVQASLLPRELPAIPGFRLAASWRAAREVAGDFYDVFPLHEGRWGIVIADVSDKGAPAALYMAMTRSLIRMVAPHHHTPAGALVQLNGLLGAQSAYDMFVTIFYAVLDPAAGELVYANAGQNPPLVRRAAGQLQPLPRTGHFVGGLERVHLTDANVALGPGDVLVAYTDGVTDALNAAGEDYGMERLVAAVQAAPAQAGPLLAYLEADLAAFVQTAPQPDDITFLVLTGDETPFTA